MSRVREEIVRIYTGDVAVNALKESIESAGREIIVASTQGDNFWLMIGSGGFARFHREFLDFYKTEGKKDCEKLTLVSQLQEALSRHR